MSMYECEYECVYGEYVFLIGYDRVYIFECVCMWMGVFAHVCICIFVWVSVCAQSVSYPPGLMFFLFECLLT